MSTRLWIIILICGGLYLLGNERVQLWDRDEPRYAQASRQMLQSGDWVVPKLLDAPRINKPPLVYWCQAAAMKLFGDNGGAARFPSAIAMTLTLILLAFTLTRVAGEEHAYWTILIFGTSGLVIMAAKMCLTDSVLLLFLTISQLCLYAFYRKRGTWGLVIAFAMATGLGLLTKGPVVLGVNATTLVILAILHLIDKNRQRNTGVSPVPTTQNTNDPINLDYQSKPAPASPILSVTLKTLLALIIITAIVAPWVYLMQQRIPGGLAKTLNHDVWNRMTQPLEQHKGPPGFYLLFFFISFFPWSLLLPTALKYAWKNRADPLLRFSFAALVGPWVMFELIATKLPHYVLPCFPFLALLTADALIRCIRNDYDDLRQKGWKIAVGIWAFIVAALGLGPWAAKWPSLGFTQLPYIAMAFVTFAAIAGAARVFYLFLQDQTARAARAMAVTMIVLMALLFGFYFPSAPFLHLSTQVGFYLQKIGANKPGDVVMIDYKEDSLPFYQGGTIRAEPRNAYLQQIDSNQWPTYMVITREIYDAAPKSAQAKLEVMKTFHGWAYAAKGRVVDVMVVRKK